MRLHDHLAFRARIQPDAEFACFGARRLDYRSADAESSRIANALVAAGLGIGDRVAVLATNCLEFALFYYAASKAGVVPVPLNYRLAPAEWAWILNDSGARLLVARGGLVEALDRVRNELTSIGTFVALEAERPGWQSWADFLDGHAGTPPAREPSETDALYQMYTSGTTGRPKGAVLSQRAVCSNVVQASMQIAGGRGERTLVVAPYYHAAAAIISFVTVFGGGSLYIQEEFAPAEVVRALSEERIRVALLVPAMIQFCLVAVPDVRERDYSALRTIVYGASSIAEATLRQAIETFRCGFLQAYGMTETTALAANLSPADHERALRDRPELLLSAGQPVLATRLRIVDEQGRDRPPGEIGEILVQGPQLMTGYWNREEATREALRGGWMHTGDAGTLDADGYLYVQDRVKDMIISGGENIYPREIEEVLYGHPAVAEAAVIGVPDDQWGESVRAVVVRKPGAAVDAEALIEFCKGRLGGFKRPRAVDFVDALPRNLSGKVLKRELREPFWRGRSRGVN